MKIKILGNPEEANKDVVTYLKVLDSSDTFWSLVELARKESDIPAGGFTNLNVDEISSPLRIPKGQIESMQDLIKNKLRFTPLMNNSLVLVRILGLPNSWLNSIMTIIIINFLIPPKPYQGALNIEFDSFFKRKSQQTDPFERSIIITITEKMTLTEIKDQISAKKEFLEDYLKLLPKPPSHLVWVNKIKNLDIRIKMNEYKKSGLTLKKIREELSKEYGEEKISFELKKSQISTYQDRFVKLIDRIIENKTVLKYYIEDKSKKLLKS